MNLNFNTNYHLSVKWNLPVAGDDNIIRKRRRDVLLGAKWEFENCLLFFVKQRDLKRTSEPSESFSWEILGWRTSLWKMLLTWTFSKLGYCLSGAWKRLISRARMQAMIQATQAIISSIRLNCSVCLYFSIKESNYI